jgi:hypothetical protein
MTATFCFDAEKMIYNPRAAQTQVEVGKKGEKRLVEKKAPAVHDSQFYKNGNVLWVRTGTLATSRRFVTSYRHLVISRHLSSPLVTSRHLSSPLITSHHPPHPSATLLRRQVRTDWGDGAGISRVLEDGALAPVQQSPSAAGMLRRVRFAADAGLDAGIVLLSSPSLVYLENHCTGTRSGDE